MKQQTREIRHFFFTQPFSDGLRTTAAVLTPALLSFYFNQFEIGFTIALGALCVALTDAPGPIIHRRNGMLACIVLVTLVAALTVLMRGNVYLLGAEVLVLSFLFSMFNVYGGRAAGVGNSALLILILNMDRPITVDQLAQHSFLILLGGVWYMLISLFLYHVNPYRTAQRALGNCLREVASYLRIKSNFYNNSSNIEVNYRQLIAQHIVVSERQDAVREHFFKTRSIVTETTTTANKLVLTFVGAVDLFDDITATYYDYTQLRERFGHTPVLGAFSALLKKMANEIDHIGLAIESNSIYRPVHDFDKLLIDLKKEVDETGKTETAESTLILKKILVNIRRMMNHIVELRRYFAKKHQLAKTHVDHTRFITHQSLDLKILWNNLSLRSTVFKHAARVSFACIAGFIIAKNLPYGQHTYWILLTIAFILKPAFSLTRQRNKERIIGTLLGGAIGIAVLLLTPTTMALFAILVLFMLGTFSFLRVHYFTMVVCTTVYVLILFQFLGMPFTQVLEERVVDTVIGCLLAFTASFLFPAWESEQVKTFMTDMLRANIKYLQQLAEILTGQPVNMLDYKLVRKEVYVSSANLSAALQRMISEPKSKQMDSKATHSFVILNHILFSNIATLVTTLMAQEQKEYPKEMISTINKAFSTLCESLKRLNNDCSIPALPLLERADKREEKDGTETHLLHTQLNFVLKLCSDIRKTTEGVIPQPAIVPPAHTPAVQAP